MQSYNALSIPRCDSTQALHIHKLFLHTIAPRRPVGHLKASRGREGSPGALAPHHRTPPARRDLGFPCLRHAPCRNCRRMLDLAAHLDASCSKGDSFSSENPRRDLETGAGLTTAHRSHPRNCRQIPESLEGSPCWCRPQGKLRESA